MQTHDGPDVSCNINRLVYLKNETLCEQIKSLDLRDKRAIFQIMRETTDLNEHTLFPLYGFTAGKFAIYHVLTENMRRSAKSSSRTLKSKKT